MNVAAVVPLILAAVGVVGIIFTAIKYNRDDTTAVVTQQSQILNDMRTLADESRASREAAIAERDECRARVIQLQAQIAGGEHG